MRKWHQLIAVFGILLMILYGFLVFDDYGQSWDEYFNYEAGKRALNAYSSGEFLRDQDDDYYHGTFYFMLYASIPKALALVQRYWLEAELRHLLNYGAFLIASYSFYGIAKLLLGRSVALITSLLFVTQPIFIGHAFINQKDIPFLGFFLLSMYLGLQASLAAENGPENSLGKESTSISWMRPSLRDLLAQGIAEWRRSDLLHRMLFSGTLFIFFVLVVELLFPVLLLPLFRDLLSAAYFHQAPKALQIAFDRIAADRETAPLLMYMQILGRLAFWGEVILLGISCFVILSLFKRIFPHLSRTLAEAAQMRDNRRYILAGAVLGLTMSIRIFGLLAGALTALLDLQRKKLASLKNIAVYGFCAFYGMYLSWPALWGDPFQQILKRISQSLDFETHMVLYGGELTPSGDLPWHYAPKIFLLKLSEPAILLITLGIALAIHRAVSGKGSRGLIAVLALWFLVPLAASLGGIIDVYADRQLFFALPPLFLFSGFAIEKVLGLALRQWIRSLLLLAAVAPGLLGILRLHPYEYAYYNALVGGIHGAEGRYQLDYWCTSYREAIEWINGHAEQGDRILVHGPDANAVTFARDDLEIVPDWRPVIGPEFITVCRSLQGLPRTFDGYRKVYEVAREGAVFAEVFRRLSMGDSIGIYDLERMPDRQNADWETSQERQPEGRY